MIVLGKEITPKTRRDELLALIARLSSLEYHVTDHEIAAARRISVARVREHMRAGIIKPAHKPGKTSSWTAPISAVLRYDEQTAIRLNQQRERAAAGS